MVPNEHMLQMNCVTNMQMNNNINVKQYHLYYDPRCYYVLSSDVLYIRHQNMDWLLEYYIIIIEYYIVAEVCIES